MQALLAVGGLLVIALAVRVFLLERKLHKIFGRGDAKTTEALVVEHASRIAEIEQALRDLGDAHGALAKNFLGSVQKVAMIRFNPFSDSGGDQSFAVALLDGKNNGLVLSSLYMRGQPLVYAKPIEKGVSKYQLSQGEADVLARAIESA